MKLIKFSEMLTEDIIGKTLHEFDHHTRDGGSAKIIGVVLSARPEGMVEEWLEIETDGPNAKCGHNLKYPIQVAKHDNGMYEWSTGYGTDYRIS